MSDYRNLVGRLSHPSERQFENFAKHVSEAHSWYKHLPPGMPGIPCHFYIAPHSGQDRVIDGKGRATHLDRIDKTHAFHYNWLSTEEYRERFSFLAYATASGTHISVIHNGEKTDYGDDASLVYTNDGFPYRVPDEVLEVGTVELTTMIHPHAGIFWFNDSNSWINSSDVSWPEESGGLNTIARIREIQQARRKRRSEISDEQFWEACIQLSEEKAKSYDLKSRKDLSSAILCVLDVRSMDYDIHQLIKPERQRQLREMVRAMERVTALIYG